MVWLDRIGAGLDSKSITGHWGLGSRWFRIERFSALCSLFAVPRWDPKSWPTKRWPRRFPNWHPIVHFLAILAVDVAALAASLSYVCLLQLQVSPSSTPLGSLSVAGLVTFPELCATLWRRPATLKRAGSVGFLAAVSMARQLGKWVQTNSRSSTEQNLAFTGEFFSQLVSSAQNGEVVFPHLPGDGL